MPGWVPGAVPASGADGQVVGGTSPRAPDLWSPAVTEVSGGGRVIRRSPGGGPPVGLEGAPLSLRRDQRERGDGRLVDGTWEEPRGTGATPEVGGGGTPVRTTARRL